MGGDLPRGQRLADNGNFTVTHGKTSLMWKQCGEGLGGVGCATGTASTFTWAQALGTAVAANLGICGRMQWDTMPDIVSL